MHSSDGIFGAPRYYKPASCALPPIGSHGSNLLPIPYLDSKLNRIFKEDKKLNVSGLRYIQNWITPDISKDLMDQIDYNIWEKDLNRRIQQYGYKYNYRDNQKQKFGLLKIYGESYIGPLPKFLDSICKRLVDEGIFPELPDQVIINEYHPGQGIAPHIDCKPCFTDTIATLSLGSHCTMIFQASVGKGSMPLVLMPNSLLIMKDKARYECFHGIRSDMCDTIGNLKVARSRRVSITFRKVK